MAVVLFSDHMCVVWYPFLASSVTDVIFKPNPYLIALSNRKDNSDDSQAYRTMSETVDVKTGNITGKTELACRCDVTDVIVLIDDRI